MKISEIQRMQQLAGIKINESEVSDHLAAKMIADKLQGTPNLTFQTIEQMVPRYLEMVGKAPTDAKYISVQVYDILSGKGLAEEGIVEDDGESAGNVYTENGYANRREYIYSLAEEYGVDVSTVISLAQLLGPSEDFDGLVTAIEDAADEY